DMYLFLLFFFYLPPDHRLLHSFPTRRSSDLSSTSAAPFCACVSTPLSVTRKACRSHVENGKTSPQRAGKVSTAALWMDPACGKRSEEHTSELQSLAYLVCRLLLEKKKKKKQQ